MAVLDCLGHPLLCKDCCRNTHQNNPFHKIQHWDKEYFKDSTLLQAGLTLHFGHSGKPCPSNVTDPSDDLYLSMSSNQSNHCHQDEGEDKPMFGLPDLPPEIIAGE